LAQLLLCIRGYKKDKHLPISDRQVRSQIKSKFKKAFAEEMHSASSYNLQQEIIKRTRLEFVKFPDTCTVTNSEIFY